MSRWAQYLIGLALALPMGAYVAGSLMASAADDPGNRAPVRISDQPGAPRPVDDDRGDDVDDNGVRVVTPQPTRLDDGDDDDGGGGAADDDGDDDDDRESKDRSRDDRD